MAKWEYLSVAFKNNDRRQAFFVVGRGREQTIANEVERALAKEADIEDVNIQKNGSIRIRRKCKEMDYLEAYKIIAKMRWEIVDGSYHEFRRPLRE